MQFFALLRRLCRRAGLDRPAASTLIYTNFQMLQRTSFTALHAQGLPKAGLFRTLMRHIDVPF